MGKVKRKMPKEGITPVKNNKQRRSLGQAEAEGEISEQSKLADVVVDNIESGVSDGQIERDNDNDVDCRIDISSEVVNKSSEDVDDEGGGNAETNEEISKDESLQINKKGEKESSEKQGKKKPKTPGIIYLSSIPEAMQYSDVYKVFSELGQVGRISLHTGGPQPRHAKMKRYAEGWIEFLDKKKAKRTVLMLNNQRVGGKKKSKWFDCIWHMKYLPKFQWSHLTERLNYEQASTQQRMRTEINQARREAQHFAEQIEWKQKETRMAAKHGDWKTNKRKYEYTQHMTDDEIRKRKVGSERVKKLDKARTNVLGSLFGGSSSTKD